MSEIIDEWIRKADADYATASREMLASEDANFDAVCFHSQQCIEKLMKAMLIKNGVTPPKTHDLFQLHLLLMPVCKKWFCRGIYPCPRIGLERCRGAVGQNDTPLGCLRIP